PGLLPIGLLFHFWQLITYSYTPVGYGTSRAPLPPLAGFFGQRPWSPRLFGYRSWVIADTIGYGSFHFFYQLLHVSGNCQWGVDLKTNVVSKAIGEFTVFQHFPGVVYANR